MSWAAQTRPRCRRPRCSSAPSRTRRSMARGRPGRRPPVRPVRQPRAQPQALCATCASSTWTLRSGSWHGSTRCSIMPLTRRPSRSLVRAGQGGVGNSRGMWVGFGEGFGEEGFGKGEVGLQSYVLRCYVYSSPMLGSTKQHRQGADSEGECISCLGTLSLGSYNTLCKGPVPCASSPPRPCRWAPGAAVAGAGV